MALLIINQQQVRQLLPMKAAMEVVTGAFKALSAGSAINPLRQVMPLPGNLGVQVTMPAYLGDPGATGLKAITVFPGNHGTAYDSHQGAVLLFGTEHGELQAIVDASAITAIRTAAASGVATQLLAREDAEDLAILGSGVQAASHLQAMLLARDIRRVRVWSRAPAHAQRFSRSASEQVGIPVEPVPTAREAVQGADISLYHDGGPYTRATGRLARAQASTSMPWAPVCPLPASWTPASWQGRGYLSTAANRHSTRPATF